jgi:hypothetical protein
MSLFEGDRWMNRDVLKSMAEIQRHAGVTISRILEKAVTPYAEKYEGWDSLSLGRTQWTCPDSPVLLCIYDVHVDPARDCCLFCESPDERK